MNVKTNHWKNLFLFGLGVFAGTAFCMKWMESDLWVNGEKFTIIGLEIFYSKDEVMSILSGLDGHVSTILGYHLYFDFAFMAGVYPAITALCMMAQHTVNSSLWRNFFFILATLQIGAWACDIAENIYLLNWLEKPVIGNEFGLFHFIVYAKWIIALTGVLFSVPVVLTKHKKS